MKVRRGTRKLVFRALDKKANRVGSFARLFILVHTLPAFDPLVNKWLPVKPPLSVNEMQACRRRKWEASVLVGWVVGRRKTRKHDRRVEHDQDNQRGRDSVFACHA
jgi:hypothetical protein